MLGAETDACFQSGRAGIDVSTAKKRVGQWPRGGSLSGDTF